MDVSTLRDWVVIVYGVLGIIAFLVVIIATVVVAMAILRLVRAARDTVDMQINPTIQTVRHTSEAIQSRVSFILDHAARPIIRTYATVSGVRRGLAAFSGLRRRPRD